MVEGQEKSLELGPKLAAFPIPARSSYDGNPEMLCSLSLSLRSFHPNPNGTSSPNHHISKAAASLSILARIVLRLHRSQTSTTLAMERDDDLSAAVMERLATRCLRLYECVPGSWQ